MVLSEEVGSKAYKKYRYFANSDSTHMRFINGNISYVAYSAAGKGWFYDGILVYKDEKLIFSSKCKEAGELFYGVSIGDINAPEDMNDDFIGAP